MTFITASFVYIWANRHHFLVNYWTLTTQTTPMFLFVFDAKEDARSMFRPKRVKISIKWRPTILTKCMHLKTSKYKVCRFSSRQKDQTIMIDKLRSKSRSTSSRETTSLCSTVVATVYTVIQVIKLFPRAMCGVLAFNSVTNVGSKSGSHNNYSDVCCIHHYVLPLVHFDVHSLIHVWVCL